MRPLPISDIIRDSFALAWRHKYLWLFGLFAGGGGFNFPTGGGDSTGGNFEDIKAWVLAALALVLIVGTLLFIVFLILHTISKSALIYNVYQIQTGGAHSLSAGWDFGWKRFWPMLVVTLSQILVLFGFMAMAVLIGVVIFYVSVPLGFLSLLFLIPFGLAVIAAALIAWGFAERFVALESKGAIEAIGEGWSMLKTEWRASVTMLLVKFAIAVAVGIGLMVIGLILIMPAVATWDTSRVISIIYGIIVLVPLFVFVGAYLGTFDSAVWTKVFLHLRAPAYAAAQAKLAQSTPPYVPPDTESSRPPLFE